MVWIFRLCYLVVVGVFLLMIWNIKIDEIGLLRWIIGWVVLMVLIENIDKIQQHFFDT